MYCHTYHCWWVWNCYQRIHQIPWDDTSWVVAWNVPEDCAIGERKNNAICVVQKMMLSVNTNGCTIMAGLNYYCLYSTCECWIGCDTMAECKKTLLIRRLHIIHLEVPLRLDTKPLFCLDFCRLHVGLQVNFNYYLPRNAFRIGRICGVHAQKHNIMMQYEWIPWVATCNSLCA